MRIILQKSLALFLSALIVLSIFVPAAVASVKDKSNSNTREDSNASNESFFVAIDNQSEAPENVNVPITPAATETVASAGNSQDNIKDSITYIPDTDESPLALKTHAIDEMSALSASDENTQLVEIIEHLRKSKKNNFWDDYHIKSGEAFKEDKQAAQKMKMLFDREKKSELNDEVLRECLIMLLQADKKLAGRAIEDATNALPYISDPTVLDEITKFIGQAEKEYTKAEEHIQKGDIVVAIEFLGKAWENANAAVTIADKKTAPEITLASPKDGTYTNNTIQTASGSVEDVALYTIKSVSLTINGITSEIPLIEGRFSQQVTLAEGANNILISVKDAFGNAGEAAASITLDTIPPDIVVTGLGDGKYYNEDVKPDIKVSDTNLQSYSVTLDGMPYAGDKITSEGRHLLEVYALDLAGNTASEKMNFTIDRTPPVVAIVSPANNTYARQIVKIDGSASDINLERVSLRIDNVEVSTSLPYVWDTSTYADGNHAIELYAEDEAENNASVTIFITVDNTSPDVTLTNPSDNAFIRQTVNIEGNADDANLASTSLRINGEEVSTSLPYPWDTLGYSDGKYSIELIALDLAGNSAKANVSVTIDNTLPQITMLSPSDNAYLNKEAEINASVVEANLEQLSVKINDSEVSQNLPYQWNTFGYQDNRYEVEVYAVDKAGNEALESINVTVDNTPPDVNFLSPLNNSYISLKYLPLLWSGVDNYGIAIYELLLNNKLLERTTNTEKAVENLEDSVYEAKVEAFDLANNSAIDAIFFTIDTLPPGIKITDVEDSRYYNTSVSPQINITDANLNFTEVTLGENSYNGESISDEGRHSLRAYAEDLAGNNATALINFTIDKTPPYASLINPAENSYLNQTVEITGTVTDSNQDFVSLSISGIKVAGSLPYMWNTSEYPDGIYTIELTATDKAGNSNSASRNVTVDNTVPAVSIIEPQDGAFVKEIISINGTIRDANFDTLSLKIDGNEVSATLPFAWDTGGYSEGAHIIELTAKDRAGNSASGSVSVIVDNVLPEVTLTSPANNSYLSKLVSIEGSTADANLNTTSLSVDGVEVSSTLPYSWDTSGYFDGAHILKLYASDRAGNEASVEVEVTVDNTAPIVNLINPLEGALLRQMVEINATITEINIRSIDLTIDGTEVSSSVPYIWDTSTYLDGEHRIRLSVSDKANNSASSDEMSVDVDNTPPILIVNELTENPTLDNPEYSLFIQADIGANVTVNGQTINLTDGSAVYSRNVTEGRNTFEITAQDAIGNPATWNITRLIDSDSLPDYYEINVTGTDPLDGDSDSSKTAGNEGNNGIPDDKEDFDGDLLPTNVEMKLGTDPFSDDTDGDGLVDLFEAYFAGTNPTIVDTEGDGTEDGNEDIDQDDLTNLKEQNFGTNPDNQDTDEDNLFDGKEIAIGTNPLDPDSDDDGLPDGMEIDAGSNPLSGDSDNDGIQDGKETITQEIVRGEINLTITGEGAIYNTLRVSNISRLEAFSEMPGNIGKVFDIRTNSSFESATIKIPYDESALGDVPENDLRIFTVNETTHRVDFLPTTVNTTNNYVQTTANHLSFYGIAGYTEWLSAWNSGSNPTTPEFKMGDKINIKTMIHNTGDAAVSSNVPVYFYEGDPDASGRYIGSATITGGINKDDSKVAIFYGYAIKSTSVDIYAKVDPLGSVPEKSELNNKAYKTLKIGPQNFDSDGDGLTDWDETNGMRTYLGIIKTDPHNNDTDDDKLSDGIEMDMRFADFYLMKSNPKVKDSDNDTLYDNEEYALNTEPLFDKDSDDDGLWDGEEVHVIGTSPTSRDTDGDGIWDGTEYLYSLGYTPQGNKAFINGDANNLLPADSEAPVTVEEIDMDMQSTLETAYSLGFEGVKIFCLGDFAEGKITISGAVDTGLCAADVGAIIIPADGPFGEAAITSVKTARFIQGVKTWFKFQRLPNALNRLKKASYVKLGLKYVLKGEPKPASIELRKAGIDEAEKLGILWQQGIFGQTLNGFGNLLRHYADDAAKIAFKIRQLAGKGVAVKDMERVYENGGDLKQTINAVEKSEDGKSVIRWLEEGTDSSGWLHIKNKHVDSGDFRNIGIPDNEVESTIYKTIKNPEEVRKSLSGEGKCYYITVGAKLIKTVVASNGYITTSHPVKPDDPKVECG